MSRHAKDARDGVRTHKAEWLRSLGDRKPVVRILEYLGLDKDTWASAERWWIAEMRRRGEDLTNGTEGGDGGPTNLGRKFTPEHVAKMAASMRGYRHTEAARRKMSEAKRGRPSPRLGVRLSEETRRLISEHRRGIPSSMRGRTHSEESKAKNAAAHRGRPAWNKGLVMGPQSPERKALQSAVMTQWWAERKAAGRVETSARQPR